jgi:hypothetical protein
MWRVEIPLGVLSSGDLMCLSYSPTGTASFLKRLTNNKGKITVYKMFALSLKEIKGKIVAKIESPMRHIPVVLKSNKWQVSNRRSVKLSNKEKADLSVSKGIHVYLKKIDVYDSNHILVKATGYKKDFVGANYSDKYEPSSGRWLRLATQAVFCKIEINLADLHKQINQRFADYISSEISDLKDNISTEDLRIDRFIEDISCIEDDISDSEEEKSRLEKRLKKLQKTKYVLK